MATSEIEKLERRYAENPHGLTFAPLAEVHRKSGDLPRALELLTAGLELHPNYIPASIVLGRCHQDLGDLPAAEAAFAHVLRLDDENVIALKSLADINEQLERFDAAESWLRRLVQVDRSNDEAREQLQRVEAARRSEIAAAPTEAAEKERTGEEIAEDPAAEETVSSPVLEMIDVSPEPAPAERAPDLLPVNLAALESPATAESPVAVDDQHPSPAHESQTRDAAVVLPETVGGAPAAPAADVPVPAPAEEHAVPEGTIEPLAGLISAEFQPPLQASGGLGVETSEEVVLEGSGNLEYRVPDASEDLKALAERFAAPRPPDAEQVRAGEAVSEAEESPAKTGDALETSAQQPARRRSYLARDTNGQSVASFFHTLLAARPPGHNGGPLAAGFAEGTAPAPPAGRSAAPSADAAVSFDDFFSSEPGGSSSLPQGTSDPGGDDLDQFQSWLQNLKR